ncbi:MAG: HNH endonuclease signature motif containing protein [bacterium]
MSALNVGQPRRSYAHPEPYQRYRQPLQAKWRPFILERDKRRCRVCGGRDDLEMAHITDAVAFVRAAGSHRGVTFSYRWDNLMTLCDGCHAVSHSHRWRAEDVPRREAVAALQEQLRGLRGWSSPFAVLPPALVPPAMAPRRSFHDTIRLSPLLPFPTFARYAADGGLVFGDAEASPGQGHLPLVAGPSGF